MDVMASDVTVRQTAPDRRPSKTLKASNILRAARGAGAKHSRRKVLLGSIRDDVTPKTPTNQRPSVFCDFVKTDTRQRTGNI